MTGQPDIIVRALLAPAATLGFSPVEWDLLVRQGRRARLLARLAYVLARDGLLQDVPIAPRQHLLAEKVVADRRAETVVREVDILAQEVAGAQVPVILLKGAAYVLAGLPTAEGRTFSDIDILVPKSGLPDVESELMLHGWQDENQDAYDQRYYRQWMHEIPPLRHLHRGTALDVHHTILPETARIKVNTPALFEGIAPLPGRPGLWVLQPWDMFLHSATHLFHEGEFESGLRDLFDLDSLLRHFGQQPGFWDGLAPRAAALGLMRPLYYALRFTTLMLQTPVPPEVLRAARAGRPAPWTARLMDALYLRALRPLHHSSRSAGSGPARFALYLRSHWIRMPVHLLAFHLGRKALVRPKPTEGDKIDAPADRAA